MPAPAGFGALQERKYDIQDTDAQARKQLADAQAANITASTPFENALRQAQTRQSNETANTIAPLAAHSISATDAGADEARARSRFYGAQSNLVGSQAQQIDQNVLSAAPDSALSAIYRTLQQNGGFGNQAPDAFGTPTTSQNERSVTDAPTTPASNVIGGAPVSSITPVSGDPNDPDNLRQQTVGLHLNKGTANVQNPRKYASGTSNVGGPPGPGQTVTSGTWTPAQNIRQLAGIPGVPRPAPPQGTGSAAPKPQGYAKGTSKVAHKGGGHMKPPGGAGPAMQSPMAPPAGMGAGAPAPGQMASAMPGPMGANAPPGGMPGLAGMLQAAMGADQVPGQGNKDTVPAMLTPGEAVVNKGAISHIPGGRDTIAKANAQGNQDKMMGGKPGLNRGMVKKPMGHNVAVHIHLH